MSGDNAPAGETAPADETTNLQSVQEDKTEGEKNAPDAEAADKPAESEPKAEDGDDEDTDKPRKRSRYDRLRDKTARLEAELAELRARSAPVGANANEATVLQAEVDRLIGEKPKEADFNGDYLAFERAQTAYEAARRVAEMTARQSLEKQRALVERDRSEMVEIYRDRIENARKGIPDYDAVLSKATTEVAPHVGEVILTDEDGPLIAYHLAKHPDKLTRLNRMSPLEAAREIGRIAASLSSPKAPVTNAPPPVKPVGSAARAAPPDLSKMSMEEYAAFRKKRA